MWVQQDEDGRKTPTRLRIVLLAVKRGRQSVNQAQAELEKTLQAERSAPPNPRLPDVHE